MITCESCGGLGRVAAGGITGQFGGAYGTEVHECGRCHGSGRITREDAGPVPRPRTGTPGITLAAVLPGDWLVEIHGSGRILAVMRFLLARNGAARRFEAHCDYGGGLLGWKAQGEWAVHPGNLVWFRGTQSSPYLLTTGYQWGVTLGRSGDDVLYGESISDEMTRWSRRAHVPTEGASPQIAPMATR